MKWVGETLWVFDDGPSGLLDDDVIAACRFSKGHRMCFRGRSGWSDGTEEMGQLLAASPVGIFSFFWWASALKRWKYSKCEVFQFVEENFKSESPTSASNKASSFSLLSIPLWCSKPKKMETPARCCHCCSSPSQHCCCRYRGGRRLLRCRCCPWEEWAWSWRKPAAGASSCWFCAPSLVGSGTRSSPGKVRFISVLVFPLRKPNIYFTDPHLCQNMIS